MPAPRLTDENIEWFHQFHALRALNLLNGINTVRQIVDFGIAPLVSNQITTLGFLCVVIGTCGLQVYFEFSADFLGFNLSITVVLMLEEMETAIDDVFIYIKLFGVLLNGILTCIYVKPINALIEQVAFGRRNLTDVPSIAAYIVIGEDVTVLISGVSIYEFIVAVHTIYCTCKSCIALRLTVRRAELVNDLIRIQ